MSSHKVSESWHDAIVHLQHMIGLKPGRADFKLRRMSRQVKRYLLRNLKLVPLSTITPSSPRSFASDHRAMIDLDIMRYSRKIYIPRFRRHMFSFCIGLSHVSFLLKDDARYVPIVVVAGLAENERRTFMDILMTIRSCFNAASWHREAVSRRKGRDVDRRLMDCALVGTTANGDIGRGSHPPQGQSCPW